MPDAVCHEGVAPRLGLRTPTYLSRKSVGAVRCGEGVRGGLECICGGIPGGFCGSFASSPFGHWSLVGMLLVGHFDMLLCSSVSAGRWCRDRLEGDTGKRNCN